MEYLLDNSDQALFPKLTDGQLERLRPIGKVRRAAMDEVLFAAGEHSYDPRVVLAGTVAVVQGHDDQARGIAPHLPGDLVAELNIFTGRARRRECDRAPARRGARDPGRGVSRARRA